MVETTEIKVQMARLEERLNTITSGLAQDRESRKQQYETMNNISQSLASLDHRVGLVERGIADSEPTIQEFISIKHKVAGAGIAGRWLWVSAGCVLTLLFTIRRELLAWLSK